MRKQRGNAWEFVWRIGERWTVYGMNNNKMEIERAWYKQITQHVGLIVLK